jgi:hypothetical protein
MSDLSKVKPSHAARKAFIYVRQSSASQVEHNRESTARQYALGDRAHQLGWPKDQVVIIDDDLGLSGASADKRSGFTRMISEVALGQVGIIPRPGSLPAGAQQCRLVSPARTVRTD